MTFANRAVANDNVFAGLPTPTVMIAPSFYDYGIIALIKDAVFDEHILRLLWINAVSIMPVSLNIEISCDNVFTFEWMDGPERAVANGKPL